MWLLLYREWDCFSRVMWGILSSHHATPNRSFRITSPRSGFRIRYTRCDFSFAWVAWGGCNRDGCSGTLMLLSSRLIVGMVGNGYRVVLVPPCVGSKVSGVDNRQWCWGTVSTREWWVPIGFQLFYAVVFPIVPFLQAHISDSGFTH